jgi:curli biogenesis system outer membrane secretion channel CsgG
MKCLLLFPALFLLFFTSKTNAQDKPKKTKVEAVKPICEGLSMADKPFVAVMPFKIAASGASQAVGAGLPDMLMNAIFGTGCFRVVERDRLNDVMKEQGLGLSGAGDEGSFAQVSKLAGAQILVFGTITEFKENESGGGGAGGGILRPRGALGIIAGGVGTSTSHIGYTLKFVNPSTGELLDSKSFDKKKTSVGVAGVGLFPGTAGGGGFYKSKSMQDAVEESLIEAIEYMSQKKSMYMEIAKERGNTNSSPKASKENCNLLAHKPKIMVIIPEASIAGAGSKYDPNKRNEIDININPPNNSNGNGVNRFMSNTPGQAGETEISKKFLEFGLDDLVDQSQFEKLKNDKSLQDAFSNPSEASKVAQRYGADIIIVGQAFSEYSKTENGMSSCRARVEVKAIMVKNAKILATEGFQGSGIDVTEIIAGKTALKSAGAKIGDYLLTQLCSKSDDIVSSMGGKQKSAGVVANTNETMLQFNNVDFNKATAIGKILQGAGGVSKVERTSFSEKIAKFTVTHTGDSNSLAEKIVKNKMGLKLDVLSVENGLVNVDVK